MAAQQSQQRQPAPPQRAEALYGLKGISGTGRLETAMPTEQRTHKIAVATNKKDQEAAHRFVNSCQCHSKLTRSSGLLAFEAAALACTTISIAGSLERRVWKLARTWRLMRLRSTAPTAAVRATLIPNLATDPLGRANTRKHASLLHLPSLKTRLYSVGVRNRAASGKPVLSRFLSMGRGSPGLWRDGRSVLGGRVWWPCAHETHESVYGVICWADRFFSWWIPAGNVLGSAGKGAILNVCLGLLSIRRVCVLAVCVCG